MKGVAHLYIHVHKVLEKINSELQAARHTSSDAELHTRIYTIKSLCELMLGENAQKMPEKEPLSKSNTSANTLTEEKALSRKQTEKTEPEDGFDGANGKSILDF